MLDDKFDEFKRDFISMCKGKNDLIDAVKSEMNGLKKWMKIWKTWMKTCVSKLEENISNQDAYERRDISVNACSNPKISKIVAKSSETPYEKNFKSI